MMTTKMTTKGQIVVPVELRRKYKLTANTVLELMDIGGEIVIIPLTVTNAIDRAKGFLRGGKSTRELLKAARTEEAKYERRKRR